MDDWVAQVEGLIAGEPLRVTRAGPVDGMRRLCAAATRALNATGAGITVMVNDRVRGVTAASDPEAERLEEIQFTTGEGPCIDAFAHRRPVLVPELTDRAMIRWPTYAPAIYDSGVRAVFAFPLQVGAARLGMMDVFRADAGNLSTAELRLAFTFAEVAVSMLLDGELQRPLGDGEGDGDGDSHGHGNVLGAGTELFQAQGMAMVQLGVSISDAMLRIRAHAYAENRSLTDVAADIVTHRIVFERDRP